MKKINWKISAAIVAVSAIFIQIIAQEKTVQPADANKDLLVMTNPPAEIRNMLRKSCYDCHSVQTKMPWYAGLPGVKSMINDHIESGRKHLNFSNWGTYTDKRMVSKLNQCANEIDKGGMPLKSYTAIHWGAKLNSTEKATLVAWFKAEADSVKAKMAVQ